MINSELLLTEFRQMLLNIERKGEKIEIKFEDLFQSFLVALKLSEKLIQEILERKVTKYGTGAHIVVPQKHLGKNAIIIMTKNLNKKQ